MIQEAMYEILRGLMLALVRFNGALVLANCVVVPMFGVIGLLFEERGIDIACIEVSINVGDSFCVVNPSFMTGLFSVVAGLVSVMIAPPPVMMDLSVAMYSSLMMDLLCAMNFPVVVAFLVMMELWVVVISLVVIVIVVLSVVAGSPCVCGFLSTNLFSIVSSHAVSTSFFETSRMKRPITIKGLGKS